MVKQSLINPPPRRACTRERVPSQRILEQPRGGTTRLCSSVRASERMRCSEVRRVLSGGFGTSEDSISSCAWSEVAESTGGPTARRSGCAGKCTLCSQKQKGLRKTKTLSEIGRGEAGGRAGPEILSRDRFSGTRRRTGL